MAIPSNKPQNRILLVGGILFALLAGVVVYLAVSKSSTPPATSTPTVNVVVAATNIVAGSQLTATNLVVHPYLVQDQPIGSYAATDQLIGKIVPVAVSAGTPITSQLLNPPPAPRVPPPHPAPSPSPRATWPWPSRPAAARPAPRSTR